MSYTLQKNDLEKLEKTKIRESLTEISRLGNLLKLAINQQSADEKLLREINKIRLNEIKREELEELKKQEFVD